MIEGEAAIEYARLRARLGLSVEPAALEVDGRYRLRRTLGRGAMGVVHEAWDERLERKVALKVVRPRPGADVVQLRRRLEREARALAQIEHPNIVAVHDVGSHDGQPYLTMQLVVGKTLRRWQVDLVPSVEQIVDAYIQAGRGLAAAHEGGVVHRDFKPDNVLVADDGTVRVVDFGVAAELRPPSSVGESDEPIELEATVASTPDGLGSNPATRSTTHTRFAGTMLYAAPEQLRGAKATDRSDQFAFCVSLWEALVGTRPFAGVTIADVLDAVGRGVPSMQGVPGWLRPVLRRGLSARASDRFPTMGAVVHRLERFAVRRRRRVIATVAVGGLALAAAAGWAISSAAHRSEQETCTDFVQRVDEVWSPQRKAALAEIAGASAASIDYVTTHLDAQTERWSAGARQLCEQDRPPAPQDPKRGCYEGWLETLERHVALLEHGDATTMAGAPDLLDRLTAPHGEFCALRPAAAVDPQVWAEAEAARDAAVIGDHTAAAEHAAVALERARAIGGDTWSVQQAEAHAAQAEVLARGGQLTRAREAFEVAEGHAIGVGYPYRLVWMRVLWAKVDALSGQPGAVERADEHLRRAEPLVASLGEGAQAWFRAEVAEANGMVARARGEHERAIGEHEDARARFEALHRPLLAARALLGAGASHQWLGDIEGAREAYRAAEAIYVAEGVAPRYRNRVKVQLNLGTLALATADAAGFGHFEHVLEYGVDDERLEALAFGIALAQARLTDDDPQTKAVAQQWVERGLAELEQRPQLPVRRAHDMKLAAGTVLAQLGDAQGEPLMLAAQELAEQLPADVAAMTEQTWIDRLWSTGRCAEAERRLSALEATVESLSEPLPGWVQWRDYFRSNSCSISTEHNHGAEDQQQK